MTLSVTPGNQILGVSGHVLRERAAIGRRHAIHGHCPLPLCDRVVPVPLAHVARELVDHVHALGDLAEGNSVVCRNW